MDEQILRLQGDLQNLVQVLIEGLKKQLSPYGVDAVEYTVLRVCTAVGQTSIRDLREVVPIDSGHMSRTTSRLEDKGLLQKIRLRGDRRLVRLRMTEDGLSLMPELMGRVQEYYTLLVTDISHEQLVGCVAVMEKMASAMEEGENPPAHAADSPEPSSDRDRDGSGVAGGAQSQSVESLVNALQGNVTRLVNVMYQGIQNRLSPFGLAVGEYSVLAACFSNDPITISGLAQHVPVDVGRISRMTSRLEDRKLIRKARLERDRRMVGVEMTEEGRALVLELMGSVNEHYVNVASRISEQELTGLTACIEKMTANAGSARGEREDGPG